MSTRHNDVYKYAMQRIDTGDSRRYRSTPGAHTVDAGDNQPTYRSAYTVRRPLQKISYRNMNSEQFAKCIEGYRLIENSELETLELNIHLVRYCRFDNGTEKFYGGGLLIKSDMPQNRYVVLMNLQNKKTWSVQTNNTRFFVRKTKKAEAASA